MNLKKYKEFVKDSSLVRCYAVIYKNKEMEATYTFKNKKDADTFYKLCKTSI